MASSHRATCTLNGHEDARLVQNPAVSGTSSAREVLVASLNSLLSCLSPLHEVLLISALTHVTCNVQQYGDFGAQLGYRLQQAAHFVLRKQLREYSCATFKISRQKLLAGKTITAKQTQTLGLLFCFPPSPFKS